jgi:hypothetical protein
MVRRPSSFKKTDLTRAAKGVLAAGLEVESVEVTADGLIKIKPSKPTDRVHKGGSIGTADDLDRELEEFAGRYGQG